MRTSVPQIDAMSSWIKISEGVGSGIGTFRTSVLFGAGLSFTAAFIIDVMTQVPRPRPAHGLAVFQLCIVRIRPSETDIAWTSSVLNRMEFRRAVSDEDEQVFPLVEFVVQHGIARVDPKDRRHRDLRGRRPRDRFLGPDSSMGRARHL